MRRLGEGPGDASLPPSPVKQEEFFFLGAYAVLTVEVVEKICNRRLLAAELLERSTDFNMRLDARVVRMTVEAIKTELLELINGDAKDCFPQRPMLRDKDNSRIG